MMSSKVKSKSRSWSLKASDPMLLLLLLLLLFRLCGGGNERLQKLFGDGGCEFAIRSVQVSGNRSKYI